MQTTTNNTAIQIEPVVKKASLLSAIKQRVTSLLSATKQGVKMILRPQWKKWKDSYDTSRFVEAVYMQEAEQGLSHDNLQQLRALEREISQTRLVARSRFTRIDNIRTKQLCGHHLSEKDTNDAFNYAVECHFSALSRGVIATEDQSLSQIRDEAFLSVFKNTPIKKVNVEVIQVVLDATPEAIEVAAETLPTETVVLNTTTLTDKQLMELRKEMAGKTSIGQLRLPQLKLYAKAHGIKIPGRSTRIKEIKNIVVAAQGNNKLLKI